MEKQIESSRIKVNSRRRGETDQFQEILKTNSLEDLSWLCSLSESELVSTSQIFFVFVCLVMNHINNLVQDLIISLKMLAVQHPKMIKHEKYAQKFDLKMLRALGMSF